ncbi:MAG: glycosyltransferase family 2 protein [Planctomycetota bacterium]
MPDTPFFDADPAPEAPRPDVSVVLPAFNEEKYLPPLLQSLRDQRTDFSIEIIVVDDNSTDRTREIAREFGATVIPNTDKLDVVGMRNLGMKRSRGRCIMLTDADSAYSRRYIQRLCAPILREGSITDVTLALWQGPLERKYAVYPDGPVPRSYLFFLRRAPWFMVGVKTPIRPLRILAEWARAGFMRNPFTIPGGGVRTGMIVVRREIMEQVGGQKGKFGSHEDTVLCHECYAVARRCLWVGGCITWFSSRRYWPKPGWRWLRLMLTKPFRSVFRLFRRRPKVSEEAGYSRPVSPR